MTGVPGEELLQQLKRMTDDMVELLSRRTGPHLHDTLGEVADEVGAARRRLGDAEELGRRHVESSMRETERTGREPTEPDRVLAPPLEPGHAVNSYGLPETQRRYPVDDYIAMWERKHGREMTPEERKVLGQGCVGVTKVRLGQAVDQGPPMNLAFADPGSHRVIQNAESVLAPGEIANAEVKDWRKQLTQAENVAKEHGMNWSATDRYGTTRSASDHLQHVKDNLEKARAEAREVWSNLAKGDIRQMLDARHEARIAGDTRTFEKVSNYAQKFRDILATKPANVEEFMRQVKADPELAQLRGVDRNLPSGDPSAWTPVIYSKHFWSGQEMARDGNGNLVFKEGRIDTRATNTPDSSRFEPDPTTGQVDMSGDYNEGKPGYVNFDYGLYDEQTGSWWHANHGDWRIYPQHGDPSTDPMKVYQSTPEKFFSSYSDFDSSVIGIGFVKNVQ